MHIEQFLIIKPYMTWNKNSKKINKKKQKYENKTRKTRNEKLKEKTN